MNDNHEAARLKNEEAEEAEEVTGVFIAADVLEELETRLDMYKRTTSWLVRELGGGEVLVPASAYEERGAVMFKVDEEGVTFRTFTQVPEVVN